MWSSWRQIIDMLEMHFFQSEKLEGKKKRIGKSNKKAIVITQVRSNIDFQ